MINILRFFAESHLKGDEPLEKVTTKVHVVDDATHQVGPDFLHSWRHHNGWHSFTLPKPHNLKLLAKDIHL